MDTRQLQAFCTVVEQKSFSRAAERLGVTQPAASLQVRSLEERVGRKLLDRSGRRVEPTEAGLALYRSAQRVLAAEEQMLAELAEDDSGELHGRLAIGASTGPGAHLVPLLLCEFAQVASRSPRRALDRGHGRRDRPRRRARARAGRRRGAAPSPLARVRAARARRDRPRRAAGACVRGPGGSARRAEGRDARRHAGGRRRPARDRGRAAPGRAPGARARVAARAGAAGVGEERGRRRATASRSSPAPGSRPSWPPERSRRPASPGSSRCARSSSSARAAGRSRAPPRASSSSPASAPRDRPLGARGVRGPPRRARDLEAAARHDAALDRPRPARRRQSSTGVRAHVPVGHGRGGHAGGRGRATASSRSAAGARSTRPRRSPRRPGSPSRPVPTTYSGAEWTRGYGVRDEAARTKGGGGGARVEGILYEPELTLGLPRGGERRDGAECARPRGRGALRRGAERGGRRARARRRGADLPGAPRRCSRTGRTADAPARAARGRDARGRRARRAPGSGSAHAIAQALGGRFGIPHGAANALVLPAALRFNEPVAGAEIARFAAAMGVDDAAGPRRGAGPPGRVPPAARPRRAARTSSRRPRPRRS